MIKETLTAYAELTKKIKALQDEQQALKDVIADQMAEANADKVMLTDEQGEDVGQFYYMNRKKYDYPEEVKAKEVEYKDAKKAYEKTATPTITKVLAFKQT